MYIEIKGEMGSAFPFLAITIGKNEEQAHIERPQGFGINQFLWVREGEGVFVVDGKKHIIAKGDGVFTRADVPHSYYGTSQLFSTSWVTFLNGSSLLDYYDVGDYFFFKAPAFLESSTARLEELCYCTSTISERVAYGYLWATELFKAVFSSKQTFVQTVDAYLEQRYGEPVTLDEIALYMNMDKFSLCRRYMKESKMTVMNKLKQLRIRKAKSILLYSDYSVEEVGNMCGFDSASYFIKIFREETGISPGKYRLKKT